MSPVQLAEKLAEAGGEVAVYSVGAVVWLHPEVGAHEGNAVTDRVTDRGAQLGAVETSESLWNIYSVVVAYFAPAPVELATEYHFMG